jgi:hypothetical protein
MRTTIWKATVVSIALGAAAAAMGQAKPPDLPAAQEVRCQDTNTTDIALADQDTGSIPPGQEAIEPNPPVAMSLDAWCPCALPLIVERLCERVLAIMQVSGPAPVVITGDEFSASAQEACRLYELACRCSREGKLERARNCLRQAHLANPTCRFGRLAIERLMEMEAIGPDEEASEPPPGSSRPPAPGDVRHSGDKFDAERQYQRMLERTQPLGLITPGTY